MFWNTKCQQLSDKLWMPDIDDKVFRTHKSFNCDNKNITFKYYDSNQEINPKLQFKKVPLVSNKEAKQKLRKRLLGIEETRMKKEMAKKQGSKSAKKLTPTEIKNKHKRMLKKIDVKVGQLDKVVRSRKVQILPDLKQQTILKRWFYDTKSIYNRTVIMFTTVYDKIFAENSDKPIKEVAKLILRNDEFPISFQKLRQKIINEFVTDFPTVPYCVTADVIKEVVSNIKGCLTKMIKGDINSFVFRHKKKNSLASTLTLESHYTTEKGFYPSMLGPIKIKNSRRNRKDKFKWSHIQHDYKLTYVKYSNKYYIHVPKYKTKIDSEKEHEIAVMDPGCRTFQMIYAPDHVVSIGENLRRVIRPRLLKIDDMKTMLETGKRHIKKTNSNKKIRKRNIKRAIDRHHQKLLHLQEELHFKTCIFLCTNYKRIMVTNFSAKQVSSKKKDLDPMTKRILGKISHYKFRQRLQQKCEEYSCQYLEVDEAYTSKTCTVCGSEKKDLGANKEYNCTNCGLIINRDINGARNILIKNHELVLK